MSLLNSVNTNTGAMIALQQLNQTNTQLNGVQNQISTGLRVSSATDDGAAFAVAQKIRSDTGALTTANNQLGNANGLLTTTISSLTQASNMVNSMRDVLVQLSDGSASASTHSQYLAQYNSDLSNLKTFFSDATYNGKTLLGNIGGTAGFGAVNVVRNEVGGTYNIGTFGGSAFAGSLTLTDTSASGASAQLQSGSAFMNKLSQIGTQLNTYGAASNYIQNQISYNSNKIDALNTGLGSLVDADLAQESAMLQSLQIKQQLGQQALTIANQAPSSLVTLIKNA